MSKSPSVDPIAWEQLPADAQRFLSGSKDACAVNLWFNDDGTPAFSPAEMGQYLGELLVLRANYLDALRCATEFTQYLTEESCLSIT